MSMSWSWMSLAFDRIRSSVIGRSMSCLRTSASPESMPMNSVAQLDACIVLSSRGLMVVG